MTPFLDLDDRAGGNFSKRRAVCFLLDAIIRFVVVAILIAIVTAVAWKVLAPFPALAAGRMR